MLVAYGSFVLRAALLKRTAAWPWYDSVPGFVRISMRPKPGRSYSAENGLELRRIWRIAERGGMRPPLKPSTNTWPPFGPAEEPASACSASASSSGSSGSASSCAPSSTTAPAAWSEERPSAAFDSVTVSVSCTAASDSALSNAVSLPATTARSLRAAASKPGRVTTTV